MHTRTALAFSSLLLITAACTQAPSHVTTPSPYSATDLQLLARLKSPLTPSTLVVENATLENTLNELARQNNIDIDANWLVLVDSGIKRDSPITLHLHDVSLGAAISAVLSETNPPVPLDFCPIDGVLHISTKKELDENASRQYIRLRYDVRDLITLPSATGTADPNRRISYLMDLLTNHIAPTTWHIMQYPEAVPARPRTNVSQSGGDTSLPYNTPSVTNDAATGEGVISAFNTSLIITQTHEIQVQVAELLTQLRGQK